MSRQRSRYTHVHEAKCQNDTGLLEVLAVAHEELDEVREHRIDAFVGVADAESGDDDG